MTRICRKAAIRTIAGAVLLLLLMSPLACSSTAKKFEMSKAKKHVENASKHFTKYNDLTTNSNNAWVQANSTPPTPDGLDQRMAILEECKETTYKQMDVELRLCIEEYRAAEELYILKT